MVKVVVGWTLAAGLLVAACGSSSDGGAGDGSAGSDDSGTGGFGASGAEGGNDGTGGDGLSPELRAELEAFCAWWADLSCELALEKTPHRVDAEHCVSTDEATCIQGFVPGVALALAEGRLVFHPENRSALAADLRRLSGTSFSERQAMPSWQSMFQGTVPNGEPCASHDGEAFYANECVDGYCPWNECPGTCEPYPGPDDECDWADHRCHPSEYCDYGCIARPAEGEPCDLDADTCLPPLRCRGAAGESQGMCAVLAELDEPCLVTSDCAEGACRDEVCTLSPVDEPCLRPSECESELTCTEELCTPRRSGSESGTFGCGSDRDCVEEQMCLSGDLWTGCGEPVRLGSACSPYQGCPRGLVCQGGSGGFTACAVPGKLGEACSAQSCGAGTYCLGGTCRAQTFNVCDPTP